MSTVLDALNKGMHDCMGASDQVVFLGEDILDPYGGAFKVARGLSTQYPERVITTPVSEAGLVGVATGLAMRGYRPIVEIMFGDFILLAADQLVNHAAKFRWMSNDRVQVPLLLRTPMGGGRGYGPTHSQTLEKHILGAPGLRVVAVTTLMSPTELLHTAVFDDDDPVILLEHKALYSLAVGEDLPEFDIHLDEKQYPTYQLRVSGAPRPSLTLVTYGYMGEIAMEAARRLAYEQEVFIEVVVLTDLIPDSQFLYDSVAESGNLLTLEEGTYTLGWGAEIAARCAERIESVNIHRMASPDMPVPAAGTLESVVLPNLDAVMDAVIAMGT